jgi:hypothetical protein
MLFAIAAAAACLVAPADALAIGGAQPPVNSTPPSIVGTLQASQVVACTNGAWLNDPLSFNYRWERDGVPVTSFSLLSTYAISNDDVGHQLTCTVLATNLSGSTSAVSAAGVPGGTPPPSDPPPAVASPAPAPGASPLPEGSDVVALPSAKRCASKRRFRIRIRRVVGVTFTSAAVFVNGRRVKVVKGDRLTAPIDLRGLPKGRFVAKIVVTTSDGRTLSHSRRYRTCSKRRRAGKRRHKL